LNPPIVAAARRRQWSLIARAKRPTALDRVTILHSNEVVRHRSDCPHRWQDEPVELRGCGKGANVMVDGRHLMVVVAGAPNGAVDVLAFQLGASGAVRSDDDLVFYNHLASPEGPVRLTAPDTFTVELDRVPISVVTVAIAIADEEAGAVIPKGVGVTVRSRSDAFWAPTEGLTTERAAILVELYRRNDTWKLRNVSAGWEQGLSALVAHHGVAVDEQPGTALTNIVHGTPAQPLAAPVLPLMVLPGNGSRRPVGQDEARAAPRSRSRAKRRSAWLAAVVAAIALLAAIFGRTPDESAPVAVADSGAAGTSSNAVSSGEASSRARFSTASAAAVNSPSPRMSPTAAGKVVAERALVAPAAVPSVRNQRGAQSAVTALEAVRVAGRAPRTGYSRAQFGQAWTDDAAVDGGHNGCDTRNDVLRRDLLKLTLRPGSNGCVVTAGTLTDPYTGRPLQFTSGKQSTVQIDHVVSLSNAWQTGATSITAAQRQNLANDPLNLQSTASAINQAKSDGDAATWLPPNKAYRCTYVARQVAVKAKYRLWVTSAERQAISTVLVTCGAKPAAPLVLPKPSPSKIASTPAMRTSTPAMRTSTPAMRTSTPAMRTSTPAMSTVAPPAVTVHAVPTASPATTSIERPAETTTPPPPVPTPELTEATLETPTTQTDSDVSYASCAAVRAAGAAPLHRGDAGYRAGLDRDDDGVACET